MLNKNQLKKFNKSKKKRRKINTILKGSPQKSGICMKLFIKKPKKPNSANRKVAKVKLSNGKIITAAIPGQGHALLEYSKIFIRGGRANDLPGIKFKLIRGKGDFVMSERIERFNRRSKFGKKLEKKKN